MSPAGKCPHGHQLADDAVYCTVCWVRVEPQDPAVELARRRRRRRIWIPFFAASALVVGVAAGGVLGIRSVGYSPSFVAQDFPSAPSESVAVVAAPLAATVGEAAAPGDDCTALILDQTVPCAIEADGVLVAVCAPAGTDRIKVSSQASQGATWQAVPSETGVGGGGVCGPDAVTAQVLIAAPVADNDGKAWRMVGRGADGQKLWSSRLVVSTGP